MIDFGGRLSLGPLESEYLEIMREWRNTPAIYKWCRQNDLISEIDQRRWFERVENDPSIKMYLIWNRNGFPIGVCGFTSIDTHNRRAEFSLYISPQFQGQGFGKEALTVLLNHGFKNVGFHSIWGETFDGNPALKTFEALGFKYEGTRRQFYFKDGGWIDAHLVSILEDEWKS